MMKRTYISIYAAIALFIILGTVVWFAYSIISESDQGEIEAENTFAYFAKSAIKLSGSTAFDEKSYKDKLIKLAEDSELKAFLISNLAGQALISWPSDSELIVYDQENKTHIDSNGLFTKIFTVQLQLSTLNGHKKTIVLTAALPTLTANDIFILSRSAFVIVLTVVILTLLMILLQSILGSSKKVYVELAPQNKAKLEEEQLKTAPYNYEPYSAYPSEEASIGETTDLKEPQVISDQAISSELQSSPKAVGTSMQVSSSNVNDDYSDPNATMPVDTYENVEENNSYTETYSEKYGVLNENVEEKKYTLEDLDNLSITKEYPYESKPNDSTLVSEEPVKAHKIPVTAEENPYADQNQNTDFSTDLTENEVITAYSKSTGVCFANELEETLAAELKRSAAAETDMALLIVKLKDLTLESIVAKQIADMLYGIVKVRDMIFEYEDDGFAAILYDKNLDLAMYEGENIYQKIQSILDEYDISEPIAIGLTTRSGRLIDADRMLEEAKAAIVRAIRSADDPIVAFRVNQKKYRDFIAEH